MEKYVEPALKLLDRDEYLVDASCTYVPDVVYVCVVTGT